MTVPAVLEVDKAEWMEDAIATIRGLSLHQPEFTADDVRREMRPAASPYWYGGAFTSAKNQGFIEAINYTTSNTKTRRHGSLRIWRRKIEGES